MAELRRVRTRTRSTPVASTALGSSVESGNALSGSVPTPRLSALDCRDFPVEKLKPPKRLTKKHTKQQIQRLKASINDFGVQRPILIDADGKIICGAGLFLAAKELGLNVLPAIVCRDLTEAQQELFRIADNGLAAMTEFDKKLLALDFLELEELQLSGELDISLQITGVSMAEIDLLVMTPPGGSTSEIGGPEEAADVETAAGPAVTQPGDVFDCGHHKLICGNSLEEETFKTLMGDERAQMAFCDAPYNVPVSGHVSGLGKPQHREFDMASGEMSPEEFTAFLTSVFALLVAFSVAGSIHYQCMDWRHMREMLSAGYAHYTELKNLIVWKKTNAGMGSFYRSQHELLFVWKSGTAKHINNFGLGDTGRYRTNVWEYAGCNTFRKGRDEDLAVHPTVKPLSLVADAIRDCSHRGGIILDPFGGSGTTMAAAERTGRKARLIEIDPHYCDVAIRRWQKQTGKDAIHVESGLTFDELAIERLGSAEA